MSKMTCTPKTFEICFGKDGHTLAENTVKAVEYFLNGLDYKNDCCMAGEWFVSRDNILDMSRIVYELKTACLTGYTPRFTVNLSEIHLLSLIMGKYGDENRSHAHKELQLYYKDIYRRMQDVKWC